MNEFELKLESSFVAPSEANFVAPGLFPPHDFPISLHPDGSVLSTFGGPCWDLSRYSDRPVRLRFGDTPLQRNSLVLDERNANIYRRATFYFLYGPRPLITASTIAAYHSALVPLFRCCADHGIVASELGRYPKIYRKLAKGVSSGQGRLLLLVLRELGQWPDLLGFQILDADQLAEMAAWVPVQRSNQYPYIPQRLYAHLVSRCRSMLTDYLEHQDGFEALFRRCLDAYVKAYGSIDAFNEVQSRWPSNPTAGRRSPFGYLAKRKATAGEFNSFADEARHFGVAEVMERWLLDEGQTLDSVDIGCFSRYLTGVCFVGQIYLAAFSGMRVSEATVLRANCFEVDDDPIFGRAYLLRGETSKTQKDENALWVTSPSAELAVRAMASVSLLRLETAKLDSRTTISDADLRNPRLVMRAYEPWSSSKEADADVNRSIIPSLGDWKTRLHKLFDVAQLRITREDMDIALQMTPSIDTDKFSVGKEWEFSFHQLRRTLACNAAASDLVSMPSLSQQLKHTTLGQTWYYGNNYSSLNLNESVKRAYEEAIIDTLVARSVQLKGDAFVSPISQKNKDRILQVLDVSELQQLRALAKKGKFSIRDTALGICMRKDACPYGGWDHLIECVSCDEALLDKRKKERVERIRDEIGRELSLIGARDSTRRNALESQMKAAKRALEILLVDE